MHGYIADRRRGSTFVEFLSTRRPSHAMAQPYATSLRSLATQKATLLLALIVDRVGLPRPGVTGEPPFAALPVLSRPFNCLSKRS